MTHALDKNVWEGPALIKNPRAGVTTKMKLLAVSVMAMILASGGIMRSRYLKFSAMGAEMSALPVVTRKFGSADVSRAFGISFRALATNKSAAAEIAAGMAYEFDIAWG